MMSGNAALLPDLRLSDGHYVFGYGSLASLDEIRKNLRNPQLSESDCPLCRLEGFRRCWNVGMDNSVVNTGYKNYAFPDTRNCPNFIIAFQNIVEDPGSFVTGVIFPATEDVLESLDTRERNYFRIDVAGALFPGQEEVQVWTYSGRSEARIRFDDGLRAGKVRITREFKERDRECLSRSRRGCIRRVREELQSPSRGRDRSRLGLQRLMLTIWNRPCLLFLIGFWPVMNRTGIPPSFAYDAFRPVRCP
jgi:hypothetical protein